MVSEQGNLSQLRIQSNSPQQVRRHVPETSTKQQLMSSEGTCTSTNTRATTHKQRKDDEQILLYFGFMINKVVQ